MSEFKLKARTALGGYHKDFGDIALCEIADQSIISIAIPSEADEDFEKNLGDAFELKMPQVGQSTTSPDGKIRLLGLQRDQLFLMSNNRDTLPVTDIAQVTGNSGYYTDQSDSWVCLRISGPRCRDALERICPIDLDGDRFTEGATARTVMEHLGAIITRETNDTFLLLSARSSAHSFLHAVETSIHNVICPPQAIVMRHQL